MRMNLFNLMATIGLDSNEFEKGIDEATKSGKKLGNQLSKNEKINKGFNTSVGLMTGALGVFAGASVKMGNDYDVAMNQLQSATGLTTEETEKLGDSMKNLYSENLGENFEDVGNTLTYASQTIADFNTDLEDVSRDALILRDTFGIEVNESIDSVNSMMQEFGITSDQAFNLIAQGAQNGANKNGDLVEIIKEYSPAFAAMGFSAEDSMNILIDGAKSGAFQVDKVGDAIKEFGIRTKDMSTSSREGFEALGLNADEMFSKFAEGGTTAQEAFHTVVEALNSTQDPLIKNQAGVALFGTMYEDLEGKAVESMLAMTDFTNSNIDTLEQINNIRYDDFGSAIQGLLRELQLMGVELSQFLLPAFNNFINFIANNKETIVQLAVAIGAGVLAMKGYLIIQTIVGMWQAYKIATEGATIAQWLLNAAMSMNPIALLVGAIAGLIAWIGYLWTTNEEFRNNVISAWNSIKETFLSFITWFEQIFTTDWSQSLGFMGDVLNGFLQGVKGFYNSVKRIFGGLIDFIAGVFTGNWSRAWQGVVDIFGGIMDGMKAVIKAPLNAVIGLINGAISGLNSISVTIPEWIPFVGGQHYGINLPKVPYLYNGGIVTQPTNMGGYVAGDAYKGRGNQAEAVVPLDKLVSWIQDVAQRPVVVAVDGREFMRSVAPYQNEFEDYSRMTSLAYR